MSLTAAAVDYINKIVRVPGMKALMLDAETSVMVGLCYSQSVLIQHQVFLTERIDAATPPPRVTASNSTSPSASFQIELEEQKQERMHHLKCLCLLRPSLSSLAALRSLLSSHRFQTVHLYFTAILSDDYLRLVADADRLRIVAAVHEYYLDYYTLHPHLFHLAVPRCRPLFCSSYSYWLGPERQLLKRHVDGLCAVLLSLKKQPEIRYVSGSEVCRLLAGDVYRTVVEERELFTFGTSQPDPPPLLLLLDRRNDPITPLLLQWTYTAMVHELLSINNNRVDLSRVSSVQPELQQITLSPDSDHFYKGSQWLNFGDLGQSIRDLVADFQRKTKNSTRLDSIEAMQRFVDGYPEFRSLSGTVSKHVSVVSELSKQVEARRLMAVSEVEQELACNEELYSAGEKVERLLKDSKISMPDALRAVMLYALRYEGQENQLSRFRHLLREKAGDERDKRRSVQLVDDVLKFAGQKVRSSDLYGNTKSFLARASQLVSGIRGVENIYTQHKPLLAETISNFLSGRALASEYPSPDPAAPTRPTYKMIVVFIVGGCTYEESAFVESINKGPSGVRIILGGSTVHNSASFMADVLDDQFRDNSLFEQDERPLTAADAKV